MTTSDSIIAYFASLIFAELGIIYEHENYYQLESRLSDVAKQLDFSSIDDLYKAAQTSLTPAMKLLLFDFATNNETLFFRDHNAFSAIESVVLANPSPKNRPLRVWSAACSTGQEVYSLAILFEKIKDKMPYSGFEILASDISERALAQAQNGIYNQLQVQRGLTATQLLAYFHQISDKEASSEWQIKPEFKKHIRFCKLNLRDSFAKLDSFDLILCRNVLIYQSTKGKQDIIERLYSRLEDGGYLLLGAAESLLGISDAFEMVQTPKATLYQKRVKK